jgi:threonine dehydratase
VVELADIQAAQLLLDGVARRTPIEGSRLLSAQVGGPVWLKCENLQRTGSFKIRGAFVRISRLTDEERRAGVVAASAGNHAQGVALAARLLDAPAVVFMPEGAPIPKVEATRSYGAEIRFAGHTVDDALVAATEYAGTSGSVLIHPFNHPDIVTGQGTVGVELLEQVPDAKTIVVSAGGGGLVSGIALAVKAQRPEAKIVAVQAAGAASFPDSLQAGRPVPVGAMSTMADGIAVGCPGDLTFDLVQKYVDEVRTVSEDSLARALLMCMERAKLVVEPAGVASVAAVLDEPGAFEPPVVAVLSGGNIDPVLLSKLIQYAMVSAGRYLSCRLRIPDRPGELAALLQLVAAQGANVLSVEHSRTGAQLHLGEVEIALSAETRGEEHCEALLAALRDAGHTAIFG